MEQWRLFVRHSIRYIFRGKVIQLIGVILIFVCSAVNIRLSVEIFSYYYWQVPPNDGSEATKRHAKNCRILIEPVGNLLCVNSTALP
jgi:hypothetical protein